MCSLGTASKKASYGSVQCPAHSSERAFDFALRNSRSASTE